MVVVSQVGAGSGPVQVEPPEMVKICRKASLVSFAVASVLGVLTFLAWVPLVTGIVRVGVLVGVGFAAKAIADCKMQSLEEQ